MSSKFKLSNLSLWNYLFFYLPYFENHYIFLYVGTTRYLVREETHDSKVSSGSTGGPRSTVWSPLSYNLSPVLFYSVLSHLYSYISLGRKSLNESGFYFYKRNFLQFRYMGPAIEQFAYFLWSSWKTNLYKFLFHKGTIRKLKTVNSSTTTYWIF